MARIFISYRREDTGYVAGFLRQSLQQRFGAGSVFMDVSDIPLGVDFRSVIDTAVAECDILLALIGDNWMNAIDAQGARRIDSSTDFVRLEIEAALAKGVPVVPVLTGTAKLPTPGELPESLQSLVYRNAAELRSGRDLDHHVAVLIDALAASLGPGPTGKHDARTERAMPSGPAPAALGDVSVQADPRAPGRAVAAIVAVLGRERWKGRIPVRPAIPSNQLGNACRLFGISDRSSVVALVDTTVFGSAKEAIVFTENSLYLKRMGGPIDVIRYAELGATEFTKAGPPPTMSKYVSAFSYQRTGSDKHTVGIGGGPLRAPDFLALMEELRGANVGR